MALPRRFDCDDLFDVDDDGVIRMTDGVFLATWKFLAGPPPPEPLFSCGIDRTADPLATSPVDSD